MMTSQKYEASRHVMKTQPVLEDVLQKRLSSMKFFFAFGVKAPSETALGNMEVVLAKRGST